MTIQATIKQKLNEIEQKENVKILHCIESGSRAWGFASPDSDYDVRFVYVRPKEYYLRLDKTRDVIEWQLDDTLDINGWDIQKTLRLLHKSNPTVFEWDNSPIVYKSSDEWEKVRALINVYFSPKAGLYHYLSTAKTNYRDYLKGDKVRLKKYFYVLRPLLACRYILDKGQPPPMLFSELVESELDEQMQPFVNRLTEMKMNTPELGVGDRISEINDYIDKSIPEIEEVLLNMPKQKDTDWGKLNDCFWELTGIL